MVRKIVLLVCLSPLLGLNIGCELVPQTPATKTLTEKEAKALFKCQTTIKKSSQKFISVKLKEFEKCADATLDLQIKLENSTHYPSRVRCCSGR